MCYRLTAFTFGRNLSREEYMKLDYTTQFDPILSPDHHQDEPKVGPINKRGKYKNRSQSSSILMGGDPKILRNNEK